MSDGLNKVLLLGNLGADPELKVTPGGQSVLKLRVATTASYLDKSNTRQERTEWHSLAIWGKRGEALSKILSKGMKIYAEGELRTTSYEKDGEKRYRTEINVLNVILCGGNGERGERTGGDRNQQHANSGGGQQSQRQAPPKNGEQQEGYGRGRQAQAPAAPPAQEEDFGGSYNDDEIPF